MSFIAVIVYFALGLFLLALWVRFIFDWVQVLQRGFRPKGPVLLVAEAAYSVTDRPLRAVRKVIPTIRFGGAGIDLGWSVLMFGTFIAWSFVGSLR
ncbi:YggT family protein [Pontimonas sp.]|jgi:YggT family protein|nr:YggT family protein [Pontimonas sp.]